MKKYTVVKLLCVALVCVLSLMFKLQTSPDVSASKENPNETSSAMLLWEKVDKGKIKVESGTAEMAYIVKNLSELEEHTQYIVRGKFLGDSVEDFLRFPKGAIYYGCTITSFPGNPGGGPESRRRHQGR